MHKNNDKYTSHTTKIAILENKHLYINETLLRIEKRLDRIDTRFDKLEEKIESGFKDVKSDLIRLESKVDSNFVYVTDKIDSHFKWILATIILTVAGFVITNCLATLAKIFHWIT
jgi:predicted nuclease with TOPRIM domain